MWKRQMFTATKAHTSTSTPKPEAIHTTDTHDDLSSLASDLMNNDEMQMNIAMQNSMKESYRQRNSFPSTLTPEGVSINEMRAKRKEYRISEARNCEEVMNNDLTHLVDSPPKNNQLSSTSHSSTFTPEHGIHGKRLMFRSSDEQYLKKRRQIMTEDLKNLMDTPSPNSCVSSKANNRVTNNGLDPAYFAATQHDSPQQENHPKTSRRSLDPSFEQKIRIETMRLMQTSDDAARVKATNLYRLLNRKRPTDEYSDIQSIALDCDHIGKTVSDTVLLMMAIIE